MLTEEEADDGSAAEAGSLTPALRMFGDGRINSLRFSCYLITGIR